MKISKREALKEIVRAVCLQSLKEIDAIPDALLEHAKEYKCEGSCREVPLKVKLLVTETAKGGG